MIEFLDDGTYVGDFSFLNGGSFSMVDSHRLKLQTAAGPRIYDFDISGEILTFAAIRIANTNMNARKSRD
jgi:hypothetical protein